jgi:hypothetical protein
MRQNKKRRPQVRLRSKDKKKWLTLKNDRKTCEEDPAVKTKARNVLNPPLRTAGPMLRSAATVRDCLLPRENEPKII